MKIKNKVNLKKAIAVSFLQVFIVIICSSCTQSLEVNKNYSILYIIIIAAFLLSVLCNIFFTDSLIKQSNEKTKEKIAKLVSQLNIIMSSNSKNNQTAKGIDDLAYYNQRNNRSDYEIDHLRDALIKFESRINKLEKNAKDSEKITGIFNNSDFQSKIETNLQSNVETNFTSITISVEEKYKEYKQKSDEEGFIKEFNCKKVDFENYRSIEMDPRAQINFVEDINGWFLIHEDVKGQHKLFPSMNVAIKSRYVDKFRIAFDILDCGSISTHFEVDSAAKVKQITINLYELMEKGSIKI